MLTVRWRLTQELRPHLQSGNILSHNQFDGTHKKYQTEHHKPPKRTEKLAHEPQKNKEHMTGINKKRAP
jgi:hypothetical protein